jgi:ABC-type multidrug transport system fused ATPase/permease subunit
VAFLSKGFDFLVEIMIYFASMLVILLNFGMIMNINKSVAIVFGASIAFYFIHGAVRIKSIMTSDKVASRSSSSLTGQLIDSLSNFQVVKLFARAKYERKFVRSARNKCITDRIYAGMMQRIFWGIPAIIWGIMFGAMLLLCANLYLSGEMKVSEIVFTLTVNAVIMGRVAHIVEDMPNMTETLGSASQSYQELIAPIAVQDVPNAPELKVSKGAIDIRNVSFKYNKKLVLNNLSLNIKPGEKVGLVGTSGAGKTTLVNLLMRLYDPARGAIFIDGQNIRNVAQDSLRENIAFIPQDTTLFNRTIRENIGYGRIGASDAEIKRAARRASADAFIMGAPKKYDTFVGDRGIKLSGGQRQRIAIARAFLKDARILILDEATAALDSETEAVIQKSFEELSQGRTTIAIAHRLSTLRNMDRIIVIDHGRIIESGTHTQLLRRRGGIYARLWKMQSGGFIQE